MASDANALFKFGTPEGEEFIPYAYSGVYEQQRTKGPDRLTIAPTADQIDLLLNLISSLKEPFGILYVLLVTGVGSTPGRYQCPRPLSYEEVRTFLTEFREFFENDGRHNIWIASLADKATLVYDKHNLIYGYGPLDTFASVTNRAGLKKGEISIPSPHVHKYNMEFAGHEERVMNYWDWKSFPLQPVDIEAY